MRARSEAFEAALTELSIFVIVVSKGWKPVVAPPFQRNAVNLNHRAHFATGRGIFAYRGGSNRFI